MPEPKDTHEASWFVIPVKGEITGPALRKRELSQIRLDFAADARMLAENCEGVENRRLSLDRRFRSYLAQKVADSFEVFERRSRQNYFRHDTCRGRAAALAWALASRYARAVWSG